MVFLELGRDSRVTTGNSGFLFNWPRDAWCCFSLAPVDETGNAHCSAMASFAPGGDGDKAPSTQTPDKQLMAPWPQLTAWLRSVSPAKYRTWRQIHDRMTLYWLYLTLLLLFTQSCPTPCDPLDYSPPGSSVHGISQARVIEWVAIYFSRGIFLTQASYACLVLCRQILYH